MAREVGYSLPDIRNAVNKTAVTIDNLVLENGNSNPEIVAARTDPSGFTYKTIGERADQEAIILTQTEEEVSQLSQNKIDKNGTGQVSYANLAQDAREQITGGNTAVVGVDAVINVNLANKAVSPEKTTFMVPRKNLINKDAVSVGQYVQWSTGLLANNTSYSTTEMIRVSPSETLTLNFGDQIAFYDLSQKYTSGLNYNNTPNNSSTFKVPSGSYYVRISIPNAKLSTAQLERGASATAYEPYKLYEEFSEVVRMKDQNFAEKSLSYTKLVEAPSIVLTESSKNLFDKENVTIGYYVRSAEGQLEANTSYAASDYIAVTPGQTYAINHFDQVAFYSSSGAFISGVDGYQLGEKTVTAPTNAAKIRVSVRLSKLDEYQLEEGETSTEYESYGRFIPAKFIPKTSEEPATKSRMFIKTIFKDVVTGSGINVKLIGDSITQGLGGTGYAQDGEVIVDDFRVNTKGYCWANLLKAYLESKFSCTVTNYGTSGRTSSYLLANIDTLVKEEDDIVICMIGTNDRNVGNNTSLQQYRDNLLAIAERVQSRGKKIIFMSSTPASVMNETDSSNPKSYHMEDVDTSVMFVAEELNMEYISLYKSFMNYCDLKNVSIDSFLPDGLHPNDAGYKIMFNIVLEELGIGRKRDDATW